MSVYLVDTDVFVDHLRAARRIPVAPVDAAFSVITRAELYAGTKADEPLIDFLLGSFAEIEVGRDIAEAAGRIRRQTELTMPDAVIAATALSVDSVLVTRNRKHFERVAGLRIHSG